MCFVLAAATDCINKCPHFALVNFNLDIITETNDFHFIDAYRATYCNCI